MVTLFGATAARLTSFVWWSTKLARERIQSQHFCKSLDPELVANIQQPGCSKLSGNTGYSREIMRAIVRSAGVLEQRTP
jgi:hypothetical protein